MNLFYQNILMIFLIFVPFLTCKEDISQIINIIYNNMKLLPYGNTVFYSKEIKCTKDDNTPIFCLVNNSLYKPQENKSDLIFNISEYKEDIYYELNILNNTYMDNNVICIITYINHTNSQIKFLYYQINKDNQIISKNESTLDIQQKTPINNYISCLKELNSQMICFYSDNNKNIQKIELNIINTGLFPKLNEQFNIKYNDSFSEDIFIVFSYLKNQIKYFLCLNSSQNNLQIYAKKDFLNNNKLRRFPNDNGQFVNNLEELNYSCQNKESLLSFSIINHQIPSSPYIEGKYYYINEDQGKLIIKSNNNITFINEAGTQNTEQIFFIRLLNNITDHSTDINLSSQMPNTAENTHLQMATSNKNSLFSNNLEYSE